MKPRTARAIRRATLIAARFGVATAPLPQVEQLLWQKFDGDILKIQQTIAYYDEHDDEIVFNTVHPASENMKEFVGSLARQHFYSTASPDHIIRHEVGHCLHYRLMSDAERTEIWYGELSPDEKRIAAAVSGYATVGRVEFVAEVYASLWSRRRCEPGVVSLYRKLRGPSR